MGTVASNKKGVTPQGKTMSINTWVRDRTDPWVEVNPEAEMGTLRVKKTGNWCTPSHCTFHIDPPSVQTCFSKRSNIHRKVN